MVVAGSQWCRRVMRTCASLLVLGGERISPYFIIIRDRVSDSAPCRFFFDDERLFFLFHLPPSRRPRPLLVGCQCGGRQIQGGHRSVQGPIGREEAQTLQLLRPRGRRSERELRRRRRQPLRRRIQRLLGIRRILPLLFVERGAGDRCGGIV